VSVHGPPEAVASLTRADFELVIGLTRIEDFTVDNLCAVPGLGVAAPSATPPEPGPDPTTAPPPPARAAPTVLLYFDQAHLTMAGRVRSLVLDAGEPVLTDRPSAWVSVICADETDDGGRWRAERTIEGAGVTSFVPIPLTFDGQACVQVRDVIPADVLGPGAFRYHLSVLYGERKLAETEYAFAATVP
jgi:hypothetical protein